MSYETHTWESGETITAEKLNHIEDGIAECCSGGDVGYECTSEWVTLTDESVTTVADEDSYEGNLAYSTPITADTIKVTFDSVEYICNRRSTPNNNCEYGALWDDATESYDFSEFPFKVNSLSRGNLLVTETAGTYSVKIEAVEESVETSDCFKKAVKSVVNIPNIAIIHSSQLGTPSVDGVSRNNIAYTKCGDGTRDDVNMYLWDGMDSYNGEPIIYVVEDEPGNNFYFVSSFEQLELCAYDEEEDATGRNLGLKERTRALWLNGADDAKMLVSPNTQFYKYYLK